MLSDEPYVKALSFRHINAISLSYFGEIALMVSAFYAKAITNQ
jgi:hypothetical protein